MTPRFLPALAVVAAAIALAVVAPAASAQTTLGFGTSLSGWTAVGDAGLPPSPGGTGPWRLFPTIHPGGGVLATTAAAAFDDDVPFAAGAVNLTGAEPVSAGLALETAFGVAPGALDPDPLAAGATEGSGFVRDLAVSAGDRLSFSWLFLTLDAGGADYAFATVDGTVIRLGGAEVGMPLVPIIPVGAPGTLDALSWSDAGWRTGEVVFTRSGMVRIGFGVVDVGDYTASSAIVVDGVVLTPVPEPSEWLMMVAGLGAAAGTARRRAVRRASRA